MKVVLQHILFLTALTLLFPVQTTAIEHTYASHSILQNGHWVKVRVGETGICRMTYDELADAGLKPAEIRVYGYGGEMLSQNFQKRKIDDLPCVPFYMDKGADGVFNSGDYILFYVTANFSWQYNGSRFAHTRNPYSDYGYYFLTDDAGEQKLLATRAALDGTDATEVKTYWNYVLHEEDRVNLLDATNGISGGGREFYGESMSPGATLTFTFPMQNIVAESEMRCVVDVASTLTSVSSQYTIQIGTKQQVLTVPGISQSDFYTMASTGLCNAMFTAAGTGKQDVSIRYQNSLGSSIGYLNYIELTAECQLTMVGSAMPFRTPVNYGSNTPIKYTLSGANENTQIWNVTENDSIYLMPTSIDGSTLTFIGSNRKNVQEYVAVNPKGTSWKSATVIGEVANQNLHKLQDIDFVIITSKELQSEAQRLAKAHEKKDGITTAVVTDEEVYNEFSSGTPDATAYRWLMKMLYDRGVGAIHKPEHLLLFGDGTFDNRKLLTSSGPATLLTYQTKNSTVETKAFATDDYFTFMDNNEGEVEVTSTMDLGVGRLPVSTTDEAKTVVDKLIAYMDNTHYGHWKQQLLFIADDGDNGLHTTTAEAGAELVRKKNPNFVVNKVYLDAYQQETTASGESYPLAKNRVENLLNNGMLFLDYSGHGGYNAITNESLMDLHSIKALTNPNHGFWAFFTCSFAHFDSGKKCAAEEAVLNANGGAIGVYSADRTVYANQNTQLNRNFCDTLFGHKNSFRYEMTLGQSNRMAKNRNGIADENKLPYILLADPAMRMAYPTQYNIETTSCSDTIRALTIHKVQGRVIDETKAVMDWFNGKVHVTVYDKLQVITTRDNDETDPQKQVLLSYNDYPNVLFSSEVEVKDGAFEFTFMAPKDIRYNYGNGRIVYYAYDEVNAAEAVGHYEDLIIGGSSTVAVVDTIGPDIKLYLNSPSFVDGGETHENPHFYADVYDENGINTVGSGIGHDLMLVVDNKPQWTYVLNDYYTGTNGDYRSGQVSYKMPELESGAHTLTFRAWDLFNNSSTKALNFTVVKDMDMSIFSITTYPNPVSQTGVVTIKLDYDRPDDLVQTDIYIYNTSGQMVWHHTQPDAKAIEWNIGEMGIPAGVYVYHMKMQTATTSAVSQNGKLIVTK